MQDGILKEYHLRVNIIGWDGEHYALGEEGGMGVVMGKEREPHLTRKKQAKQNKKLYHKAKGYVRYARMYKGEKC